MGVGPHKLNRIFSTHSIKKRLRANAHQQKATAFHGNVIEWLEVCVKNADTDNSHNR